MTHNIVNEDIKNIAEAIKTDAMKLEGRTLLISGGAGFLGSYIIATVFYLNKHYFSKPCRVISIDNFITGKKRRIIEEITDKNLIFMEADVTKQLDIPQKVDYIMHAAGLASPVYYQKYPLETIESAIYGVRNLLDLAHKKKVKSFLFFSSSEIYGDPDPNFIPTPETYRGNVSAIGPRACYDESKRLGETICMVYYNKYNVPVKIVRPFNVYGPGMMPDDYRVVPMFISSALKGKALPVHDKGNQTRTFCYISDAVIGFLKVLLSKKSGEVYNVGNDENEINMMKLAMTVSELFNNKIEVHAIQYPKKYPQDEPKRRCPDLTKIRTQIGYAPTVDLKHGLARVIKWYKEEYAL